MLRSQFLLTPFYWYASTWEFPRHDISVRGDKWFYLDWVLLCSLLFCRGFIIISIYLSILLSISITSATTKPSSAPDSPPPVFSDHMLLNLKFSDECFIDLSFIPVFFWPLYCLSFFDLRYMTPLWYLQTFLIICFYQY